MDKKILEYVQTSERSPGPAAYCVKPTIGKCATDPSIEKNPAYSIRGRNYYQVCVIGPGPAFDTTDMNEHGRHRVPRVVLGARYTRHDPAPTPGPADYCVNEPRTTIGPKMKRPAGHRADRWCGPAPNAYQLPDGRGRPWAVLIGKPGDRGPKCVTPGPGQYDTPHPDLYLAGATRAGRTMAGRPKARRTARGCTPGPADYDGGRRVNCCARPRGAAADECARQPCRVTFGVRWPAKVGVFAVPRDNDYGC